MARIFLSHSSSNNAEAIALSKWLFGKGWNDVFLDLDPKQGLIAGERWQIALRQASERCEVVILLLSPEWIESDWCKFEYVLAKQLNKQIVGVIVSPTPLEGFPPDLLADWQLVDLTQGQRDYSITVRLPNAVTTTEVAFNNEGLIRLELGLKRAGLTPTFFDWPPPNDPDRSPFPGLRPLTTEDAGIFFGRDSSIIAGLDMIRGMRSASSPQVLYILGASGSGKSSFLHAGLIPRIKRDDRNFLPLPVIRPERGVIQGDLGLIAALATAAGEARLSISRTEIRAAVKRGAEGLLSLFDRLIAHHSRSSAEAGAQPPTVLLIIDQAEELFVSEGADEAATFFRLLQDLLAARQRAPVIVIATRSDSYEQFQTRREMELSSQKILTLPPMPGGAYVEIIRGPIERAVASGRKLTIEENLVEALLIDVEKGGAKDSLPLLAFTLERLYRECAGDGDLRLVEYRTLGGIKGSIEAAVESTLRRLSQNDDVPRAREAQLTLLKRALIPWLAGIDPETGSPRRRIARLSEIPSEARPVVKQLIEDRLLSKDVDPVTGEVTVEPSHEALLRQWGVLGEWLQEDLHALAAIEGVQRSARDWLSNARDSEWLSHSGARLAFAQTVAQRDDLKGLLTQGDYEYLATAQAQEDQARNQKLSALRRQRAIAGTLAAVFCVLCLGLWFLWDKSWRQGRNLAASLAVTRAQAAMSNGDVQGAAVNAMQGFDINATADTRSALFTSVMALSPHLLSVHRLSEGRPEVLIWQDAQTVAIAANDGRLYHVAQPAAGEAQSEPRVVDTLQHVDGIEQRVVPRALRVRSDGALFSVLSNSATFVTRSGSKSVSVHPGSNSVLVSARQHAAAIALEGALVALVVDDGVLLLRCEVKGPNSSCVEKTMSLRGVSSVALSKDGGRMLVGTTEGSVDLYEIGASVHHLAHGSTPGEVLGLAWLEGASHAVAGTSRGDVVLFEIASDLSVATRASIKCPRPVSVLNWSPRGADFAFACGSDIQAVRLEIAADGSVALIKSDPFIGHTNEVTALQWSPDGTKLASGSVDRTIRIWSQNPDQTVRYSFLTGQEAPLRSAAFNSQTRTLAAGSESGALFIWDVEGRMQAYAAPRPSSLVSLAWGPDGRLAAVSSDGAIIVLEKGKFGPSTPGSEAVHSRAVWIDAATLAALPGNGILVALISADGRKLRNLDGVSHFQTPWGLATHPRVPKLFVSYSNGGVHAWNTETAQYAGEIVAEQGEGVTGQERFRGPRSIDVMPDGSYLATSRYDRQVILHPLRPDRASIHLPIERPGTVAVAFAPTGRHFAALDEAGTLYVWAITASGADLLVSGSAVPSHPGNRSRRKAMTLVWVGPTKLAIPTSDGAVEILSIQADHWRERVRRLFGDPQAMVQPNEF